MAFSGEPEYGGAKVSEASLNGFPSRQIAAKFRENPLSLPGLRGQVPDRLRRAVAAHDVRGQNALPASKAVQTLSRLNRAHPKKHDVFVLDFLNDAEIIRHAFADYYRTTILADETDTNKLHDLQADLDGVRVYMPEQVDDFVKRYLDGAEPRPARSDP